MLLILLGIISLITIIFLYIGYEQQRLILETIIKEEKSVASKISSQTFDNFIQKYESIASNILLNEQIIESLEKKDRNELLKLTLPIYEKLRKENPYLQIMHFHTADTKSFLRLHKPEKFGDDLSSIRHMINKVNKLKVKQIGIEVGRYGIHYRVALPIFNSKKDFLGVFEFGININYLLEIFKNHYNFETILLFKKDLFKIMVTNYKNIMYANYSDEYYSIKFRDNNSSIEKKNTVSVNDNVIKFTVHTIKDNSNQTIGELVFIKNIDTYTNSIKQIKYLSIGSAIILLLISFYLVRKIFSNYIKTIESYQKKLEIKNNSLLKLSNTDHLTQINNRKSIETILKNEINRSKRYSHPLSVILFDIDNFKKINDSLGHNVGDKVLKGMSKLVSSCLRETDYCGRWGGEEFIILLTETSLDAGYITSEKLRKCIHAHDFEDIKDVSCSFGIAELSPEDTYESIVHNADTALYEAKNNGKNRVTIYSI